MPQLSVTSPSDKPTPQQKLEQTLLRDFAVGEPTRLRIPIQVYDRETRDYRALPDLAWNLSFAPGTEVREIEDVVEALGRCLVAIGRDGAEMVQRKVDCGDDPT
jgi:hypothetical protein